MICVVIVVVVCLFVVVVVVVLIFTWSRIAATGVLEVVWIALSTPGRELSLAATKISLELL